MNPKFLQTLWVFLFLYIIGLTCSVAGMEGGMAFLTLFTIIGSLVWGNMYKKLGPDYFLWAFWIIVVIGALLIPEATFSEKREAIGDARFVVSFYVLTAVLFALQDKLQKSLYVLFTSSILVSWYGIAQFFTGLDLTHKTPYTLAIMKGYDLFRVKAFYTNTMSYSYLFGMIFCLILAFCFYAPKSKWTWFFKLGAITIGMSLIMTFTRGLWVAGVIAALLMTYVYSRKIFVRSAIAIVLLTGIAFTLSPQVRYRLGTFVTGDGSQSKRVNIWRANWEMFKDHPVVGIGYEKNAVFVEEYNMKLYGEPGFIGHAHNHFLQVLAGTGLLGFICFIGFTGYFFVTAVRLWGVAGSDWFLKAIALGSIGAQIVFHIGGLTEAVFSDRESNHMYIFVVALTLVAFKTVARKQPA